MRNKSETGICRDLLEFPYTQLIEENENSAEATQSQITAPSKLIRVKRAKRLKAKVKVPRKRHQLFTKRNSMMLILVFGCALVASTLAIQ